MPPSITLTWPGPPPVFYFQGGIATRGQCDDLASDKLSKREWLLLKLIQALTKGPGEGCYATNAYLGRSINVDAKYAGRLVNGMIKKGLLKSYSRPNGWGEQRYLEVVRDVSHGVVGGTQERESPTEKMLTPPAQERESPTEKSPTITKGINEDKHRGVISSPSDASAGLRPASYHRASAHATEKRALPLSGVERHPTGKNPPQTAKGSATTPNPTPRPLHPQDQPMPRSAIIANISTTKKLTGGAPSAQDHLWAKTLAEALRASGKLTNRRMSTTDWATHFRHLTADLDDDTDRIDVALEWYCKNIGQRYVPEAQSAKSFRDKFIKVEEAMRRDPTAAPPGPPVSAEAEELATWAARWHWPKGSRDRLPRFAQDCLDGYDDLHHRWTSVKATMTSLGYRDDPKKRPLLYLLDASAKLVGQRKNTVRNHLERVYHKIENWEAWPGDLKPYTFGTRCQFFRGDLVTVASDNGGSDAHMRAAALNEMLDKVKGASK